MTDDLVIILVHKSTGHSQNFINRSKLHFVRPAFRRQDVLLKHSCGVLFSLKSRRKTNAEPTSRNGN